MEPKIIKKKDNTYCCVPQCNSRGSKTNYSFHLFPSIKSVVRKTTSNGIKVLVSRRMEWKRILRIGKEISNRMTVCSKHFSADAFTFPPGKCLRTRLKPYALPTLFLPKTPTSEEKTSRKEKEKKKEKRLKEENSAKILGHFPDIKRFPLNDPERLQKWLKALKRESWQPTKHSFLCSQHFTPDSYKSSPKHFLKDDAVPTINCFSTDHPKIVRKRTIDYPLPNPLKKPVVVLQRNSVLEQYSDSNGSPKPPLGSCQCDTLHKSKETVNNKNSSFEANELQIYKDAVCDGTFVTSGDDVSDIEFSDSENTEQRLEIMTAHYKKTKKKLKICQQRCNLYKKEITALKEVIDSLRQINSVSDEN